MTAARFALCLLLHWLPAVSVVSRHLLVRSARFDKAWISPYLFQQLNFCSVPTSRILQFLESGKIEAEIIRPLSQLHFGGEGRAFLAITLHKLLSSKNALEYFNSVILGMLVPFSGRSWSISRLPEKMTNLKQFLNFASANPVLQVAGSVKSYSMKQRLHISISPSPLLITALWSHASELYKHPAEWLCITYINVF